MLSIRFGYGLPAALAIALAEDLALGESFLDTFLGFGLSQTCFLAAITFSLHPFFWQTSLTWQSLPSFYR